VRTSRAKAFHGRFHEVVEKIHEGLPSLVHAEQDAEDEGANGQGHAERLEVAFQFGVVGVGFGFHG
jgi:hypothetical protein